MPSNRAGFDESSVYLAPGWTVHADNSKKGQLLEERLNVFDITSDGRGSGEQKPRRRG